MKLTWMGHACFALEAEGYRVVLDPFAGVTGLPDIHTQANAVYCSHGHHDHRYLEGVTVHPNGKNPFTVETLDTFHDGQQGKLRGKNTVHIFTVEGLRVVHLGDLGHLLTEEQAARLRNCDVLLLPVGGTYTIDGGQAAQTVAQLQPRLVLPMHYRSDTFGFAALSTVEPFLQKVVGYPVERRTESSLEINTDVDKKIILLTPGV